MTRTQPGPRERLLDAAKRLSYSHGVSVGVDALLREANVARRSLYEHFGGKDGLITEMLRRSAAEDVARYRTAMDRGGADPRARLLAIFDWLAEVVREPDFRGCRYQAADLALAQPGHPGHAVTREYRAELDRMLLHELAGLGHPDPDGAAAQLHLLIEGAMATGAVRPARELAEKILS
jgi:AcrR family transcriptional regulator